MELNKWTSGQAMTGLPGRGQNTQQAFPIHLMKNTPRWPTHTHKCPLTTKLFTHLIIITIIIPVFVVGGGKNTHLPPSYEHVTTTATTQLLSGKGRHRCLLRSSQVCCCCCGCENGGRMQKYVAQPLRRLACSHTIILLSHTTFYEFACLRKNLQENRVRKGKTTGWKSGVASRLRGCKDDILLLILLGVYTLGLLATWKGRAKNNGVCFVIFCLVGGLFSPVNCLWYMASWQLE